MPLWTVLCEVFPAPSEAKPVPREVSLMIASMKASKTANPLAEMQSAMEASTPLYSVEKNLQLNYSQDWNAMEISPMHPTLGSMMVSINASGSSALSLDSNLSGCGSGIVFEGDGPARPEVIC
ncbi:hypothetical protein C8J56DRAFT_1056120 [Mycena floridula]|nr:hypothetical protein C8J56DRAFT_1056120 [Mycena floridula]